MDVRDRIVKEGIEAWLSSDRKSCIMACPRSGKTFMGVEVLKRYKNPLICFPRNDIKTGWLNTFKLLGYKGNVTFTTFNSLKHQLDKNWDIIVVDEIHEASVACLANIGRFQCDLLGLSGTMTQTTRKKVCDEAGMDVCYDYTIEQGVEEGILADYTIYIHTVPLDDIRKIYKKDTVTEARYFRSLDYVKRGLKGNSKFFIELKMMAVLQNSISRTKYTRKLIEDNKNDRILIFCGNTAVADSLGIPVYHSKKKEEKLFKEFCEGRGCKHCATVKMAQAGITVVPIHKGILNYTTGATEDCAQKISRFLCLEYNNPKKQAELHLICSNENFERIRIETALSFFDPNKIIEL